LISCAATVSGSDEPRGAVKPHLFFTFLLSLALAAPLVCAEPPTKPYDHAAWSQFLKQHVNEQGDVNYGALQKDPALLDAYLKELSALDFLNLQEWPREELMALWINAYHAALIKNVLKYYPIKNVHEAPGFWDEDVLNIGGRLFGLNEIRTRFLLDIYRDPKIHTALSYAAKSGPKLQREAYTGPTVEGQLFQTARHFVNDPDKNQIVPGSKKIHISKIFEWYPKDFEFDFGVFENERGFENQIFAVLSFIAYYLDDEEKIRYLEDSKYKVKYLSFDWTLNDWK
jgi:hypothetical protein